MVRNSIQDKFNTQSSSEILSRKRLTPFFFPFFLSNFQILVTQINIELINYHIIELDEEKLGSSLDLATISFPPSLLPCFVGQCSRPYRSQQFRETISNAGPSTGGAASYRFARLALRL